MHTLWLWLVIPGAIITYLVIGFFASLLFFKIEETDWRDEIDGEFVVMILLWPITLLVALSRWINPVRLLERIAELSKREDDD